MFVCITMKIICMYVYKRVCICPGTFFILYLLKRLHQKPSRASATAGAPKRSYYFSSDLRNEWPVI